ncbi:MAG: hypothetical protein II737_07170, partial [Mailhella sp.]|nr:hypothetical protein [Mailhella sp.]
MYIQKRTYSYYFRLQVPRSLRPSYGKAEICFSLNTLDRAEARLKALEYSHQYLLEFEQRKALPISQTVNPTTTQSNVSAIGASYS